MQIIFDIVQQPELCVFGSVSYHFPLKLSHLQGSNFVHSASNFYLINSETTYDLMWSLFKSINQLHLLPYTPKIIMPPLPCLTVRNEIFHLKSRTLFSPQHFTFFHAKGTEFTLIREYYFYQKLKRFIYIFICES